MAEQVENQPSLIPSGAFYHDNGNGGALTFGLWAPNKQNVYLIGDFNHWERTATAMHPQADGMWGAELVLPTGNYGYQFVVDAGTEHEVVIADPYARALRWVEGQPQPHSLITVGSALYAWQDQDFQAKPLNELIIYELHVGDFSPEGTFAGVTQRLDYIRDLGVNAIELMPIQEFPGDRSWGYNPAFFFCPESAYGSADDLKTLIDQAHQRGIAVILDMVFNHTAESNPLMSLYPYQENPFFGQDGNPWGFPDFNHWSDATKRLTKDIQDYWLNEFHIDGFRYDHAEGIGFDFMSGMQFIAWSARQTKPNVYLIVENLPDPTSMVQATEVDASWHEAFHGIVRAQLREGEYQGRQYGDMQALLDKLIFAHDGYSDNAQAINYLENHDQERVAFEIRTNPTLDNDEAVRAKAKLGALVLFTAAGVPLLYAGQEFATSTRKTIDENKLQWERLNDPVWQDLKNWYSSMGQLRSQNAALRLNYLEPLLVDNERKLLVFKRWNDEGNQVVVGLNFAPNQQFAEVDFPRAGKWHEWTNNYDEELGDNSHFTIELPPSGGKVWVAVG